MARTLTHLLAFSRIRDPRATGGAQCSALRERLPEPVARAVVEFITGDLLVEPKRVGKPLLRELEGVFSARRGVYPVLYEIDEEGQTVKVIDIAHRSDAYRRR